MKPYIPNVTTKLALNLTSSHFDDAGLARVSLTDSVIASKILDSDIKLWVDTGVDGYFDLKARQPSVGSDAPWYRFHSNFPHFTEFEKPEFIKKPDQRRVDEFVAALLDECCRRSPTWITIPQLPFRSGTIENKINKALALATGKWKSGSGFRGELILPLVFNDRNSILNGTQRKNKVTEASKNFEIACAGGYWVVDANFDSESTSSETRGTRISKLVSLHQDINERIQSHVRIAGPYWGLDILLWARGLVDYALIGLSSYQHYISGLPPRVFASATPASKFALKCLFRRVRYNKGLESWIKDVLTRTSVGTAQHLELSGVLANFSLFSDVKRSARRNAEIYRDWFNELDSIEPAGRSLVLFQKLAVAFSFGKGLRKLDDSEKAAKEPASIAEPLMLNCL